MSWYKKASFADTVGVASFGDSGAVVIIGNRKYTYSNYDGNAINNTITKYKSMHNKQLSGKYIQQYLDKIKPYLVKEEAFDANDEPLQDLMNRSVEIPQQEFNWGDEEKV